MLALSLALSGGCAVVGVTAPSYEDRTTVRSMRDGRKRVPTIADLGALPSIRDRPDRVRKRISGTSETWTVDHGRRYCGPVLVIVPLMAKLCRARTVYQFESGYLVRERSRTMRLFGVVCSPLNALFAVKSGGRGRYCELRPKSTPRSGGI